MAVLAYSGYAYYYKTFPGTTPKVSKTLAERIDNGEQLRDQTFNTMADYIGHPDVKNNNFSTRSALTNDIGIYGQNRKFYEMYTGNSELTEMYRESNLSL